MSCEQNSNKVSKIAGLRSGVIALSNKVGNVAGSVIGRWAQAQDVANEKIFRRVAPVSTRVLRTVDRPAVAVAKAAPVVASVIAYTRFRGYALTQPDGPPVAAVAVTLRSPEESAQYRKSINTVRKGVGLMGTISGVSTALTAQALKGTSGARTLELKQKGQVVATVEFQKAQKLTGLLNKGDLIGSHLLGKNVVATEGDVVRSKGVTTWHRGTSVVKTAQGERTLTHLQTLKLPSRHLYFNRKLSDEEVAGIVSGREKSHKLPGYAGEVHAMESLAPLWGSTKKAMIINSLYWPTPTANWSVTDGKGRSDPTQSQTVTMKAVKPKTQAEQT